MSYVAAGQPTAMFGYALLQGGSMALTMAILKLVIASVTFADSYVKLCTAKEKARERLHDLRRRQVRTQYRLLRVRVKVERRFLTRFTKSYFSAELAEFSDRDFWTELRPISMNVSKRRKRLQDLRYSYEAALAAELVAVRPTVPVRIPRRLFSGTDCYSTDHNASKLRSSGGQRAALAAPKEARVISTAEPKSNAPRGQAAAVAVTTPAPPSQASVIGHDLLLSYQEEYEDLLAAFGLGEQTECEEHSGAQQRSSTKSARSQSV